MKTGFWLKGGKGKLAGATVYQQNGETVMREVVSPTNPKTEKQIIQRIIMHTVMQAYSKMKEICDHSFEGFKKGQDTMSYFMQRNIQICRMKVAEMQAQGTAFLNMYNFVPLGLKGFTANQYQISMGSLPSVECNLRDDDEAKGFVPAIKTNTYEAVINALNLQRGDQLTFIMIDANTAAQFGQCNFHFCRVILDPTNADFTQAPLSTPFLDENGKINKPSVRNEGNFTFAISATTGLSFNYNGSLTCRACAVIVSRQVNDNWLRSTAYLTYDGQSEYSMQECIDAAESGSVSNIYAANSQYLNNAGQGGGVGAQDTNGGSGSGGSGTAPVVNTPTINSVSVDGNAAVAGTTKVVEYPQGSTWPLTKSVVVNGSNVSNMFAVVLDGAQEVASAEFENGVATLSHAWAKDKVYTIVLQDEESNNTSTSYSFQLKEEGGLSMD